MNIKNKNLALTGGAAAAEALKQINPDVMPVYPITPQTPIIETFAKMVADGEADTEIIDVESEHSAMSAAVGASAAGARTATASSSQGIMLMAEILPIASGMRLPILMLVSARAISAPINIHGDHQDVMAVRDLGWIQLFSENAQEVYDNAIIGLKLAETVKLPVMVIMDGFTTSHSVENLEILEMQAVKNFVAEYNPKNSLLDFENPKTFGPVSLPNSYFEFKRAEIEAMNGVVAKLSETNRNYAEISGREYDLFEAYRLDDAEKAIIVAGSTAGTAKVAVDELREKGEKVGHRRRRAGGGADLVLESRRGGVREAVTEDYLSGDRARRRAVGAGPARGSRRGWSRVAATLARGGARDGRTVAASSSRPTAAR